MAHLWTGGEAPAAYIELVLCRDVFHCRPQELAEIPFSKVLQVLTCLDVEAKVSKQRAGKYSERV